MVDNDSPKKAQELTVVLFGAFDFDYPRERLIARSLDSAGVETVECRYNRERSISGPSMLILLLPISVRLLFTLVAHLRREDVDSILVMRDNLMFLPVARVAATVFGVRLVLDAFDPDYHNARMKGRAQPRLALLWAREFVGLRLADVCLATTRAFVELYTETYYLSADRFAVVPPGADEDTFSPLDASQAIDISIDSAQDGDEGDGADQSSDRFDGRGSVGERCQDERLSVVYWGNFHPHHGVDVVLEAVEMLADEGIEFTLAGDGDRQDWYLEWARDRGLENVAFPGRLSDDELRARISAADVCLGVFSPHRLAQCSLTNKVLEGMAMGKPVVTECSPATDEIDDAVVRVSPGSSKALAEALRALADDTSKREILGTRARKTFEERFSERAIGERIRDALL